MTTDFVTTDQAKALYEEQLTRASSARKDKRKHKEKPLWDTGKNLTLGDGKKGLVVIVEEEQDALTLTSFDNTHPNSEKSFGELFTSVKLVAYKDENGAEKMERMYVKADLEYAQRKNFHIEDKDFSGRIWYEDFDDNFLRAFLYKDGKLIGMQNPEKPNLKNARISDDVICNYIYETITTTTTYWSIACTPATGDCGPPKFMYNSTQTSVQVMFESCYRTGTTYPGPSGTESFDILDSAFWDKWTGLNQLERDWLLSNPGKAWDFYQNVRKAEVSSQQRFGGNTLKDEDGTNQNAYKHAYLAALHTLSWGPNIADELMDAHENGPNTPGIDAQMDYFNNNLGINRINLCGCDGEALRNFIQQSIGAGQGRRHITGNTHTSTNVLIPTTSANLDHD